MKKLLLSSALLVATVSIANDLENSNKKEPNKISEQKRFEIVKNAKQPVFFWEIKTSYGVASGYTNSEASAKKTIKLMSSNDVVSSKIIETYR